MTETVVSRSLGMRCMYASVCRENMTLIVVIVSRHQCLIAFACLALDSVAVPILRHYPFCKVSVVKELKKSKQKSR